ncbi:MAG TPA: ABC transporter ATP-binding protein [Cyclobacteriaceae bacterium]|nr:ABC transporter ATP-binding protein [Cyclobacteriaceae bacterium]
MKKGENILQGRDVAVGYRQGKAIRWVVKNLSFSLQSAKLTCLLGPNGVGKSTLIKAIMGQNLPVKGEISYKGKPIGQLSPRDMARNVSVVLTDRISPGNLTVRQLVALGRIPFTSWLGSMSPEDEQAVQKALDATHIGYIENRKVSEISDGQLQKTMIARALAQDGKLIILDEPTAHLDLVNRLEIMQLLRDIAHTQQKAILVVTHDLDIAVETADEFWLMPCGGPVVIGRPEDLILSGAINQLLPDGKLQFSPTTGKVQAIMAEETIPVDGPEEVAQWLRMALRKQNMLPSNALRLSVTKDPVSFLIYRKETKEQFYTIEETLNALQLE